MPVTVASGVISSNAVSGPDRRESLISERDRITASPLAINGLPVRDCCRQATIR